MWLLSSVIIKPTKWKPPFCGDRVEFDNFFNLIILVESLFAPDQTWCTFARLFLATFAPLCNVYYTIYVCNACVSKDRFPCSVCAKFYDVVCFAIKVRDVCSILAGAVRTDSVRNAAQWVEFDFRGTLLFLFIGTILRN